MKTSHFRLLLILFIILAGSCASKNEAIDTAAGDATAPTPVQVVNVPSDLYSNGIVKLIKTANYRFEVENAQRSIDAIETSIRKYHGFISSSDMRVDNPLLENKITIRVANEYFQDLLKEIDKQAQYVNFRDIKTEDVSKQFVDLESRLKTKREVEQRYIEILRKKAGTIEELLNAEKQIGELQEEIEATVSRINYLKDEVRYSTINLEFYQTIAVETTVAGANTTWQDMKKALLSGWMGLLAVITGVLYLWPLLFIGVVCTIAFMARRKRKFIKAA